MKVFNDSLFKISHIPALDSISEHYLENEAMIAWWNDWKARDQRAKIEKTYNHGRFSREKRTLGLSTLLINRCHPCFILIVITLVYLMSSSLFFLPSFCRSIPVSLSFSIFSVKTWNGILWTGLVKKEPKLIQISKILA